MSAAAIIAAYILANAQAVAVDAERDRLALTHGTGVVVESAMPKPSPQWADAWAASMVSSALFPRDPRIEVAHGLVYAYLESRYDDRPKRGDSGLAACSLGVHVFAPKWVTIDGWTLDEIEADPAKCIQSARSAMRWSFGVNPDRPMSAYCGCGTAPCPVADRRTALVKKIAAKLPPLEPKP